MTTGNLYLQVFNKASGRFIEIPENIGAISFLTTPTGLQSFNQTPNFSGFVFSRPVRINGSIEMSPISIGANNFSGSGLGLGGNIGFYNQDNITIRDLATGQYYGNYNLGTFNNFLNNIHSYNIGYFNSSQLSELSFNVGGQNTISGSIDSYNIGISNILKSGNDVYLIGASNILNSGLNLSLVGNNNALTKVINSLIVGNSNSLSNNTNVTVFSNNNSITTGTNVYNFGDSNAYSNVEDSKVFGANNILTNSQFQNFYGEGNSSINSDNNVIFGNSNNLLSGAVQNIVYGNLNTFASLGSRIYGDNNLTDYDTYSSLVYGSNNAISGATNALILGSNNTLDTFLLNELYLIELTGVTGLGIGQTPFTGTTGYRMLGGYAGIPGSGGVSNVIVGNNNNTSLNYFTNVFGNDNQALNNSESYIFGDSNYAEKSTNSYVFGENNSVSGFQNYIIGNNNTVRSGDYNTILIGISHEFTGDFKVASVNIASVDSKIEVSPSEVKITSPNRAKFNNQDLVVNSDLANYLNNSNGLSNSGVFLTNIFQDPSYSNLPNQIQLDTFSYSGKEDRYYGGFSGANGANLNAYRFTGFFRKTETLYYTGDHSIYGDFYYQSDNENFDILFSKTLEPVTGNWILSPNTGLGVLFCNKSTNTGVFPLNNWLRSGNAGFSGYNPAPSFMYQNEFTGRFVKEILQASDNLIFPYFSNLGAQGYRSSQGISLIYGLHSNPTSGFNNPTWLIIDNYSSGLYYRNDLYNSTTIPQTGWTVTGYMGYSGINTVSPNQILGNSTGVNLVIGTRTGFVSSYDPTYGKIYIPFYY